MMRDAQSEMNRFRAQGLVSNGAQGLESNAKNDDSNVDDNAEYRFLPW